MIECTWKILEIFNQITADSAESRKQKSLFRLFDQEEIEVSVCTNKQNKDMANNKLLFLSSRYLDTDRFDPIRSERVILFFLLQRFYWSCQPTQHILVLGVGLCLHSRWQMFACARGRSPTLETWRRWQRPKRFWLSFQS